MKNDEAVVIVTGGAGFIGSRLVRALNKHGKSRVVVVDNLENGGKFRNLVGCQIVDYVDKRDFLTQIDSGRWNRAQVAAVFHQGACSVTTEWDGRYMMDNNFTYSKGLLHWCTRRGIPFVYASSASVYGRSTRFEDMPGPHEHPLNVYGYSKLLFDQYVRARQHAFHSQVVGLRYFNVYGPGEQHKGAMASVIWHFRNQLRDAGVVKLFTGTDGYANGEQRRDFVHVDDVAAVNLWFLEYPHVSGIFNVGTGRARSFNDVARAVIDVVGAGRIEYTPFPEHLVGAYQSFTEADLEQLRTKGCSTGFRSLEDGVRDYLGVLDKSP